jgi:hypothetical protein
MIALLTAVLLLSQPQDTPTITVRLDPQRARVGETVTLRISVRSSTGAPTIETPRLNPSLQTVGTQDYTELSIGFNRSNRVTRDIVLIAHAPGQYSIPAFRVTINGKAHMTLPLLLEVTGDAQPIDPDVRPSDARLSVRMVPDTVYVGQQSTLVGEVMLTPDLQMRLTRPPSYDAPAPSDFWIQTLPPDPTTDIQYINGQRFIVQRFYGAYFPLTPGRYSFAPARVTYEARQGFLFAPQTRELRSASPRVTVLPIPEEGRPTTFNGAVGNLSITSMVMPERAAVGDAVSLVIEVKGTGNIKALPPPILPRVDGVEILEPSETTELSNDQRTIKGTKRFTWVLVPEREGVVDLPAIEYTSFDPEARTFRHHQTDPGDLEVAAAGALGATEFVGLRPRRTPERLGWVRSPGFAAVQLAPVVLIGLALAFRRRRSGPPAKLKQDWNTRLNALRTARANPLAHAERLLRESLNSLYPSARLQSGSPAELRSELERTTSGAFADQVARLVERIERARYSPSELSQHEREAILDELRAILDDAWSHARASAPRLAVWPFALMLLQSPVQTFDQGISAYQARQFSQAVAYFEQFTAQAPDDAAGWYNLGIAYQADRRPAHAAWALLHSVEREPRRSGTDRHLRALGVTRLAERVRPIVPLTTNEVLLISSILWLLAGSLTAVAIAKRKRRIATLALFPAALAGVLLLTHTVERALPPLAIVFEKGAPLLAGKSRHADVVRHLQPLTGISVLEDDDNWLRVRTSDGEVGWVAADDVGRI